MHVRLAFAVMMQVDADVLLIDEVLAVGDAAFQQKCFDEFARIRDAGKHDPARHARHGRRRSASATARCCSSAARSSRSATRTASPTATSSSTSSRARRRRAGRERRPSRSATATGAPRSSRRGSRTRTASAPTRVPAGERCAFCCRVRFRETVDDPLFGVVLAERPRRHVLDGLQPAGGPAAGRFAAGEEVDVPHRFENLLVAGPLPRDAGGGARRQRRRVDRPARALRLRRRDRRARDGRGGRPALRGRARARRACLEEVPRERRRRRARAARSRGPTALGTDPRRFWHLTRALARHRVQAALLRLGARLPVAARAAAAAVRRPLRGVHPGRRLGDDVELYARRAAARASCSSRSSARRPAARSSSLVDRENLVRKIEFPRLAVPLVGRAHRAVQPRRSTSCVVVVFLLAAGGEVRAELAGAVPSSSRCSPCFAPALAMLLSRAVRALPRRQADLGRASCRCSSTRRRSSTRSDVVAERRPELAQGADAQPVRGDPPAGPPRAASTPSHDTAAQAIGGGWRLLVPLAIIASRSPSATACSAAPRRGSPRISRRTASPPLSGRSEWYENVPGGLASRCARTGDHRSRAATAASAAAPSIHVLSNRADVISGGDALVAVDLPAGISPARSRSPPAAATSRAPSRCGRTGASRASSPASRSATTSLHGDAARRARATA